LLYQIRFQNDWINMSSAEMCECLVLFIVCRAMTDICLLL